MEKFGILLVSVEKAVPFVRQEEIRRIFDELVDRGFFFRSRPHRTIEEKYAEFAMWFRHNCGGYSDNIREDIEYIIEDWYIERFCPHCLDGISFECETEFRTYRGEIITDREGFHLAETRHLHKHFADNVAEMSVYNESGKLLFRRGLLNGSLVNKPTVILTSKLTIPSNKTEEAECTYIMKSLWELESWIIYGSVTIDKKFIYIDRAFFRDEPEESIKQLTCLSYKNDKWNLPFWHHNETQPAKEE